MKYNIIIPGRSDGCAHCALFSYSHYDWCQEHAAAVSIA